MGYGKVSVLLFVVALLLCLWKINFSKSSSSAEWTTVSSATSDSIAVDRRSTADAGTGNSWHQILNSGIGIGFNPPELHRNFDKSIGQGQPPPGPPNVQPMEGSQAKVNVDPMKPAGVGVPACERPPENGIPSPVYPPGGEDDVIFLNGYHWGSVYIRPTLESIRASGCKAKLVFLAPHSDSFAGFLTGNDEVIAPFMPAVVLPMSCQETGVDKASKEVPRPNHLFLFFAALKALMMPEFARTRRVIVQDIIDTFWFDDLFKFVSPTENVVYAPTLSYFRPQGRFTSFCQGAPSLSGPAQFSAETHYFSRVVASSSSAAMQALLSRLNDVTRNYTICSYHEALNTYLLTMAAGSNSDATMKVQVWTSDFGPISHHDETICGILKQQDAAGHRPPQQVAGPMISMCNTPTVAVLTARCAAVDRAVPSRK